MQYSDRQSGFTLIETILYIGLFVLIMGSVIMATYNLIESTDKTQYRSLIHNEAQFSIRKFHWLLNGATNISVPSAGTLQLTNTAISVNPITMQLQGNALSVTIDGVTTVLTGAIAPVTSLAFSHTAAAGLTPAQTQISFRMQNKYYDETFTSKKLIR